VPLSSLGLKVKLEFCLVASVTAQCRARARSTLFDPGETPFRDDSRKIY
jgi:hypothetical protein